MIIDISSIRHSPSDSLSFDLRETLQPQLFGYDSFQLPQPVSCSGMLQDEHNGSYRLSASYSAMAELICGRCGAAYSLPLSGQFTALFSVDSNEDQQGETEVFPLVGDRAQLDQALLAEIFFALPMRPLCREDCRGLCPVCGVNLNEQSCSCQQDHIDPRWEKLKDLRFD